VRQIVPFRDRRLANLNALAADRRDDHRVLAAENLARGAYAMTKDDKILHENRGAHLWAIGSYWLLAVVCFIGVIILLTGMVSPWLILPSIVVIEIILLCIGALILMATERAGFLQLIALAARLQFQWSAFLSADENPRESEEPKPSNSKVA
jgi:hypothetical protein